MHICYAISPGGGPETYVRTLGSWLISRGHKVSVIRQGPEMNFRPEIEQVSTAVGNLHYYAARLFGRFGSWARLLKAYEHETAILRALEAIHGRNPVDIVEVVEGIPVGRLKKICKTVVRIHGSDWSFRYFCKDGGGQDDSALIRLEKKQIENADGVASISEHSAVHVSGICRVPRAKICVIPYPFEKKGGIQAVKREKAVMCVGRIEKRNGTHLLCKAMVSVWEKHPETNVYLFGKESDLTREDLLGLIPESRHARLYFMGFATQEKLAEYYRRVSVYAAPTQYETFGCTLLEAMAYGVPIVTTDAGAVPELVQDGKQGYLFPYGDYEKLAALIIRLLGEEAECNRLAECGLKRASDFLPEVVGPKMLSFYERVLRGAS
jgi:glycosyltransferase involved in cell wall biosynthesis